MTLLLNTNQTNVAIDSPLPSRGETQKTRVATNVADHAVLALQQEPCVWPRFGLVGPQDNGTHTDMNYALLSRSAESLRDFFVDSYRLGYANNASNDELFDIWRQRGVQSEQAMFSATKGVNTHKGANFIFGLLCLARGVQKRTKSDARSSVEKLLEIAYELAGPTITIELATTPRGISQTYGEWACHRYQCRGIRGLVVDRFALLAQAYAWYQAHPNLSAETRLSYLRLFFLCYCEDSNIVKRAGFAKAVELKRVAQAALQGGGVLSNLSAVDEVEQYMQNNGWSAAAAGDLTAALLFLVGISDEK